MDEKTFIALIAAIAAVAASGIGAGGAILAQFLSVRATDKASATRFEWEQKQAIRREKAERDALFADAKREVFAKFLAVHNGCQLDITKALVVSPEDRAAALREASRKLVMEAFQAQADVALLAPSLSDDTNALLNTAGNLLRTVKKNFAEAGTSGPVDHGDILNDYRESIRTCREAMAAHLYDEHASEPASRVNVSDGDANSN